MLTYFEISYPNFVLGSIIDPVEANQNNNDIVTKTNLIVDAVNLNEKNNYDAMVSHKTSGDHDSRYYTETEVNAMITSLNNKDISQDQALTNHKISPDHDGRYYTKDYLTLWLRGGDTNIKEEIFIITTSF